MKCLYSLDTHTITELMKRKRPPQIFAPLGNGPYFHSLGIKDEQVHTLDWWEGRRVEINVKTELNNAQVKADAESAPTFNAKLAFDVTCTPAQHFTGRGLHDRFRTLWASWAIQEVVPTESESTTKGIQVYFAGDTGYRAVRDGQDQDAVPTCPAFKEIGERFGGFDFAMIPIGYVDLFWGNISGWVLIDDTELTSRVISCPQSIVHRMIVSPCSRIFGRRKR